MLRHASTFKLELLGDTPLDDKLVLMGMSCVGKTSLAGLLARQTYSFDAQYRYRLNGLPGVSKHRQWERIARGCSDPVFVLDNWTTEDRLGETLYSVHPDACVAVLFDHYPNILRRYRVAVTGEDGHRMMFERMYYDTPFEDYKNRVRFLKVDLENSAYHEYSVAEFRSWYAGAFEGDGLVFDRESWTWRDV